MQSRAKNEVFSHFMVFGLSGWSDIAYSGTVNWYLAGNDNLVLGTGINYPGLAELIQKRANNELFDHFIDFGWFDCS